MTSPVSALEAIEKAMEGVTPGPWDVWEERTPTKADAVAEMAYQVENSEPFAEAVYLLNANGKCPATTGCGPTSAANAAYIAACSPDRMREVLDELYALRETALQVEAMKREVAELREALKPFADYVNNEWTDAHGDDTPVCDECVEFIAQLGAFRRARTLTQGEKNA